MCLAIPGKIVKIEKNFGMVQYPGEQRKVMLDPLIPVVLGDYVLVQMGIVIQKVSEEEAKSSWEVWQS